MRIGKTLCRYDTDTKKALPGETMVNHTDTHSDEVVQCVIGVNLVVAEYD